MKHRHRPVSLDSSKFVNEIKKYSALYDPSDSEYRNMEHKNAAWRTISAVVQLPVRDCQLRWKSLRDRFVRERKSYKQDPTNKVTWPLYYHLTFLSNYISHKSRQKSGSNSEDGLSDEEDDESGKHNDEIEFNESNANGNSELGVRVGEISISPVSSLNSTKSTGSRSVGRKRSLDETKVVEMLTKLVSRSEPDEDELFFMSAAKMMKQVSADKKTSLKVKIMQMIADEELT